MTHTFQLLCYKQQQTNNTQTTNNCLPNVECLMHAVQSHSAPIACVMTASPYLHKSLQGVAETVAAVCQPWDVKTGDSARPRGGCHSSCGRRSLFCCRRYYCSSSFGCSCSPSAPGAGHDERAVPLSSAAAHAVRAATQGRSKAQQVRTVICKSSCCLGTK